MHEYKTSCPKCDGHVAYPKESSGQIAACPHCGESIVLPNNKLSKAWIAAGVFGFIIVCLAGALISKSHLRIPAGTSQVPDVSIKSSSHSRDQEDSENQPETERDSEDIKAMASLCKRYYQAFNNQDANTLQKLIPESFRMILTLDTWKQTFESDTKYEFINLESVNFQDGSKGKIATARVKRFWQNPTIGIQEGWRNFKFIKEPDGWKLFRTEEIIDEIVGQFIKSGFTDEVKGIIQTLRDNDPFEIWDKDSCINNFRVTSGDTTIFHCASLLQRAA